MTAAKQELWAKLSAVGLITGKMPEDGGAHTPWYVRVMLGAAGLIAAVFLLGFVGVGFAFVVESNIASIAVGLVVITASYAIFRTAPRNDFAAMFALAVSMAGQALVAYGIFGLAGREMRGAGPWAIMAALEAALALVMPNFIHRAASAYAAGLALSFACELAGIRSLTIGVLAAAIASAWLNEARLATRRSVITPVAYGLTLSFIQIEGTTRFGRPMAMLFGGSPFAQSMPWLGEALVGAALLAAVIVLLRRNGWATGEARTVFALVAATAIGIASFKAPGIAGGLMIALLGFANGNRVLTGLGIAALLFYVSSYYYFLDTTLLMKSGVLLATGIVLLAVRWVVLNVIMRKGGRNA